MTSLLTFAPLTDCRTGFDNGFDWKEVAASAIASGAGWSVGQTSVDKIPVVGGVASGIAAGAASTLARGGSLTKNLPSITADAVASTVGNMVVDRVASASTSTLYGPAGNVDDMVRQAAQASYNVSAGDQFAGMASWDLSFQAGLREQAFVGGLQDQFGQLANDALAASRAQDQALKQQLSSEFAGTANTALAAQRAEHAAPAARINTAGLDFGRGPNNWSDDALAIDLGHRGGSWSEGDVRLAQTEGGFGRGLFGPPRNVFEAQAPLSEKIGAGIGAGLTAIGDLFAVPVIEVGNQYRDLYAAANGATGGWSSGLAQQVSAGNYGAAALTELGAVAGTMPLAGATLRGVASVAPAFADTAYGMSERYLVGARMYAVPPAEVNFGATFGTAVSNDYRATFFTANPGLEGQVVVHHAVEQQVLTKFPGVVSSAEVHSLENLRGIPVELNSELHLSQLRVEWNRFYRPFLAGGGHHQLKLSCFKRRLSLITDLAPSSSLP